jgi:hypothetical protein
MNLELFRSKHAVAAAVPALTCLGWHYIIDQPFGSRSAANLTYLLATGWLAVALYIVLALYAVRKAAHRSGLSPEFLVDEGALTRLEKVQSEIRSLQNETAAGALTSGGTVRRTARGILSRNGMQRVLRVQIERATGNPGYRIHVLPREPLGRLAKWVHAHVYYGMAAALVVWFHGGGRVGSPMGLWLNVLSALVILTGLFGIVLWSLGPRWLTRRERELPTEKAFAFHEHYRRKVHEQVEKLSGGEDPDLPPHVAKTLVGGKDLSTEQRETLRALANNSSPIRDLLVLLGQQKRVDQEWGRLRRFRIYFNAWRWIHLPCSALLLALVITHVFSIWHY